MKRLFIAFLLVVFSSQGIVVAVGKNLTDANAVLAAEKQFANHNSTADDENIELSAFDKVSSDIEEMSDYVPIDWATNPGAGDPISPLTDIHPFISINLPKALPPPRS